MSHSAPGRITLRTLKSLWSVALAFFLIGAFAQPASAITLGGTDPVDASSAPLDLLSSKIVFDSSAGKATMTIQTAATNVGTVPASFFALLGKRAGNQCAPDGEAAGVLVFSAIWVAEGEGFKWVLSNPVAFGELDVQRSGNTITATIAADSRLKGLDFDCAQVQSKTSTTLPDGNVEDTDIDAMNLFEGASSTVVPPPVFTDQPDKDKDGVADTKDKCPDVAGGAANGCLTIADRLAIRLGSKRVAIDKLVARTAAVCPLKAKVTVTLKKKKIGTGVVSVSTHGSFCRAYGVVKLKKTVKAKTKVKIVVKATGMGSIAATRKR